MRSNAHALSKSEILCLAMKRLSNVVPNKKGASRGRRLLREGSGRANVLVEK
jgi:hypothetical protein